MTELKTKPSSTHLRTPKAKRKLGLFVPAVRLPHEYLIQSNHSSPNPFNGLVPGLPGPSQAHRTESGISAKGVPDSAKPSVIDESGIPERGAPETGIPCQCPLVPCESDARSWHRTDTHWASKPSMTPCGKLHVLTVTKPGSSASAIEGWQHSPA